MKKIAVIGITGKELTFNVTEGLIKSNYSLECVILRKKKHKADNIFVRTLRNLNFKNIIRIAKNVKNGKQKFDVKGICEKNGVKVLLEYDVNSMKIINTLAKIKPDIIVLAGPPIIKKEVFTLAKLYTINIHRSLLPKYAGLDAIFWALYNNENEIGASVHIVNEEIDAGDIVYQKSRKVEENDTLDSLTQWYLNVAPELIINALDNIFSDNPKFIKQDLSERTYYSRPSEEQKKELQMRINHLHS